MRRTAWVAPVVGGQVVVYDEASESQAEEEYRGLAERLSRQLKAPCLMVLNHDDDLLLYELYEDGKRTEEFNSNPGFLGRLRAGSKGTRLCSVWGQPARAFAVANLLTKKFVFAVELHEALAKELGLPDHSIGTGFKYIEQGEFPDEALAERLLKVGTGSKVG